MDRRMKTTSWRLAAALFTLAALGGCTSSVTVVHTVPPQYSIVPAKVIAVIGTKEKIDLDGKAPFFNEGMAKIKKDDLAAARALWEGHLAALPESAPLLYNLGAVSEALRDRGAAEDYYARAAKAAPGTARYAHALDHLDERADDEETSKKTAAALVAEAAAAEAAKEATLAKADVMIAQAAKVRAAQTRETA